MYARYTEVLSDLMKNERTAAALNKALSTYPLYKPKKLYDQIPTRDELNKKILNHYKYREIGFETVGRFLDELEITMNEIMPLYNERYKTIEIMADIPNPFDNVDITEEYTEERTGETSQESNGTNRDTSERTGTESANGKENSQSESSTNSSSSQNHNGKKVHSETPQDSLAIAAKDINNVNYADDVEWNKDEASDTSNSSASGSSNTTNETSSKTQESVETNGESSATSSGTSKYNVHHKTTRTGQQGVSTFANDIDEFRRKAIIDVTNEIINDENLNDLFMKIF